MDATVNTLGSGDLSIVYINGVYPITIEHDGITPRANKLTRIAADGYIKNLTPIDVIKFCQENDIVVEAYSPIAHGRALKNETIKKMAEKYNVSIPQLCIKYTLQLNTVSIPKASSKEHIEDNTKLDFVIKDEDMVELLKANRVDYSEDSFWPVFNKAK